METEKKKTQDDYIEIKLPKFSFKNGITNPFLVILLVIFSYLLGMMTTKIQYLETASNNKTAQAIPQAQAAVPPQQQAVKAPIKVDVDPGNFPTRGNQEAKVTIVEFGDFRCPFCKRSFDQVEPQLEKDYINSGKVKFAFRNYAFLGPASVIAAEGAACANEQEKFWDYHDYMYKNQPEESDTSMYTSDRLSEIAGTLGMDALQFKTCMDTHKYAKQVQADLAAGQKASVQATPTFYINGMQLVGAQPYPAFDQAIKAAL